MSNKCSTTGKTIFLDLAGARARIATLRIRHWDSVTGKRINRHNKKPEQKRAYYCEYCEGYHLTSQAVHLKEIKPKSKKRKR